MNDAMHTLSGVQNPLLVAAGMVSMNAALVPSHLAVGFLLHMTFSIVVGVSFALICSLPSGR